MTDRAGFFAGLSDVLTQMCAYYVVAGLLVMGSSWGVHLFWLLLCAAACAFVFAFVLKKPRGVPVLTALVGVLFLAVMGVFWLVSTTPMRFGYGFVLAIGAGMAVGLPLHYAIKRPLIHQHLAWLDGLIIALTGLLLTREALGIDGGTVALMTAVLFLDAAAAVGLRMSDGGDGDGANALRASMIALGSAVALALVIGLVTALFSRSGGVTESVLHGIGSFFSAIGRGIERFFRWFASLVEVHEELTPMELEEMPSLAGMEGGASSGSVQVSGGAVGAVIAVLVIAIVTAVVLIFRKTRVSRGTVSAADASSDTVRRTGGGARAVWERLRQRLRFRWTAFLRRNTPGGVLVILERRGKRARKPRLTGESMRGFIRRMDPGGGLDELADALDREYYGGERNTLDPGRCRALRRYIRKAVV